MIHAVKLSMSIDTSFFKEELLTPHQKYHRVQKYARNLQGTSIPYSETMGLVNADIFIEQLPAALIALERPSVFLLELAAADHEDAILPAHVDIKKTCGINVYLEANGEITKFYDWDAQARQSVYAEEFCANTGDVWLMDTTTPHSVDLVRNKRRRLLTFSFTKTPYKTVLETL